MPRKVLELPVKPPPLPEKLPGEDTVSRGVNSVLNLIERDPLLGLVNRLVDKIPIIPEKTYVTPFGTLKTPEFYIPRITPAKFNEREREAFKAATMVDLSSLISKIPWLGTAAGPAADAVEDTAYAKIHDTLTPEEDKYFKSYDKVDPLATIAMIRTMVRTQKEA
jgi:hypothetical protein